VDGAYFKCEIELIEGNTNKLCVPWPISLLKQINKWKRKRIQASELCSGNVVETMNLFFGGDYFSKCN